MSEPGWTLEQDAALCNTLALPARATWLARIHDPAALPALLALPHLRGLPVRVLGSGSNVVLPRQLQALVLQPEFAAVHTEVASDGQTLSLIADAGLNWHQLVHWSVLQGWHGLENLALIPGQCGAAPIQNIGAYGVEVADVLNWVQWLELPSGKLIRMSRDQLELGYRHSRFKHMPVGSFVILRICLALQRNAPLRTGYAGIAEHLARRGIDRPQLRDVFDSVCALRQSKLPDPARQPNVGSFFKNPQVDAQQAQRLKLRFPEMPLWPGPDGRCKLSAAWLIERAGFKGRQLGEAAVAAQHALVLINPGQADAQAIRDLSVAIQHSVQAEFAVQLECEPQFW